jgi:hypothetical protein
MRVHFLHGPRHVEIVHAYETPFSAILGMLTNVFFVPVYCTGEQ